ncbi:MAG: hypothetical protein ACRD3M_04435 [Thermoanaerobaculia bacterium]
MLSRFFLGSLLGGLLAVASPASDEPPTHVTVSVDGAALDGVTGYRIEFNRQTIPRTDSRRLDLAYSPDQRRLAFTVTQKGLNRLQEWINSATEGGAPSAKTVVVTARDSKDEVLVRWELSGVVPTTLSSAAAGQFDQITATLEFVFDRMRLVEASGK